MPGVFLRALRPGPGVGLSPNSARTLATEVIETGIVHAQLAQRLLKRKQILGVGAERPAGPGDQRGDNLGHWYPVQTVDGADP